MKVYVVFKTRNNGAHYRDEVHCVRETQEAAERARAAVGGYICDYDTI